MKNYIEELNILIGKLLAHFAGKDFEKSDKTIKEILKHEEKAIRSAKKEAVEECIKEVKEIFDGMTIDSSPEFTVGYKLATKDARYRTISRLKELLK